MPGTSGLIAAGFPLPCISEAEEGEGGEGEGGACPSGPRAGRVHLEVFPGLPSLYVTLRAACVAARPAGRHAAAPEPVHSQGRAPSRPLTSLQERMEKKKILQRARTHNRTRVVNVSNSGD